MTPRQGGGAEGATFHVSLLIGRRLFWEVGPAGIIEVPEVARDAAVLVSFDQHDHRLRALQKRSSRQARLAFMREWGEAVRLVNRARDLGAVYGRDPGQSVARPAGCRLVPGLQLMDQLALLRAVDPAGRVLGLRLGAGDGNGRRLVLLFAYDAQGELQGFQEAANPPALDYLVDEFCRSLAVTPATGEPIWFDQHDAADVLALLRPYPDEDELFELPLRCWWQAGQRASLACSALALGWSMWGAFDAWSAHVEAQQAQATRRQLAGVIQQGLRQHLRALAWSETVDLAHLFRDAEALWRPGTRVQVLALPDHIDYTLRLAQPGPADARPSAGRSSWLPHPLRATLDAGGAELPAGVHALDPAIGGDLNAYYLRFRRETPLPALAAVAADQP
ncbi:MAG: hypothetical protein KGI67_03005 [Pseudomonadota bacterium]|nr:hypothetical protein [Pseudomonadota bacterium]